LDLRLISISVISLVVGVFNIAKGINLYKKKIIIKHISVRMEAAFFYSIYMLSGLTFIGNDGFYLTGFIMGIILIILFGIYLVYSRQNDVKYIVYNADKKSLQEFFRESIIKALTENQIEFKIISNFIKVKGSCTHIEFIDKEFIIKKYKQLPDYEKVILNFEANLKNIELVKEKKEWLTAVIGGVCFIFMAIVVFFVSIR